MGYKSGDSLVCHIRRSLKRLDNIPPLVNDANDDRKRLSFTEVEDERVTVFGHQHFGESFREFPLHDTTIPNSLEALPHRRRQLPDVLGLIAAGQTGHFHMLQTQHVDILDNQTQSE